LPQYATERHAEHRFDCVVALPQFAHASSPAAIADDVSPAEAPVFEELIDHSVLSMKVCVEHTER
jgi:hypothetical protein